jgi:20S proteasome alpha/beta subunit
MTTIAYRDGVLAADSQSTFRGNREGMVTKIAQRGPVLAAVCGLAPNAIAFLDWFRTGMVGSVPHMGDKEDNAWGFVYPPGERIIWFKPGGTEYFRAPLHASGSGADFAIGAMTFGATPEEAVAVAAKHDIHTGGEIVVLRREPRFRLVVNG